MLPGRKSAFRLAFLAGLLPGKHRNPPPGRPMPGRRADFGSFPVAVQPKSGPETRFTAREHYCVTSNRIYILILVDFGRFQTKLGPRTTPNGFGSKNGAERTYSQPRKPKLMPFCDILCSTIRGWLLEAIKNMFLEFRPGPPESPESAGKGGPGPPRYRRTAPGNR